MPTVTATFRDGTTITHITPLTGISSTTICQHCGVLVGQVQFTPGIVTTGRLLQHGFCDKHGPDYGILSSSGLWELPVNILAEEFRRLSQTILESPWEGKLPDFAPDFILPRILQTHHFTGDYYVRPA